MKFALSGDTHNRIPFAPLLLCAFALSLFLSGCEPEATPYPVDLPTTNTPTPLTATPSPIRYGVSAYIPAADLELLRASGQVEIINGEITPADLGNRFDLIAATGTFPDALRSPVSSGVALVLNNTLPPLDDPAVLSIVQRALSEAETASTAALRTELANAGWPDGFDITLAHADIPGVTAVVEALQPLGIQTRLQPIQNVVWENVHAALVTTANPDEYQAWTNHAGAPVIDLFSTPISYWAVDGLTITFTPGGWPLAAR